MTTAESHDVEMEASPASVEQVLATLKVLKNSLVGNRKAKAALVDTGSIGWMVDWLVGGGSSGDDPELVQIARIEVVRVIATLGNSNSQTTLQLVRARTLDALIHCLANPSSSSRASYKGIESALCNALRSIVASCAEVLGPVGWGLSADHSTLERDEARQAIELLFQSETMPAYLPSLASSQDAAISIALLLNSSLSCWDTIGPRRTIADYYPPDSRALTRSPSSSSSAWERSPDARDRAPEGWVVDRLLKLLELPDQKAKEAGLLALGALACDNPSVAGALYRRKTTQGITTLADIFGLTTSRNLQVQFAAVLCVTRVLKALGADMPTQLARLNRSTFNPAHTLIMILNNCISDLDISTEMRSKYVFTLGLLVADEERFQEAVSTCGSLSALLKILVDNRPRKDESEWAEEVPKSVSRLREAAFKALALSTMSADSIRRKVLEDRSTGVSYTSLISEGLEDPDVGVRFAVCQCARALSRSVEVLRTSVIDSGLGMKLWDLLQTEQDRRVQLILLMCMSNLMLDFSPLREVLFKRGVIQKIVQLTDHSDDAVKLNAVWAIRNTLYRGTAKDHRFVFEQMGMDRFYRLLTCSHSKVKQQAIILLRNTVTMEEPCLYLMNQMGIEKVFSVLKEGVNDDEDETIVQAVNALDNIARNTDSRMFLAQSAVLEALKTRLWSTTAPHLKKSLLGITLTLAKSSEYAVKRLKEEGFDTAVREILRQLEGAPGDHHDLAAVARNIQHVFGAR